MSYALNSKYGVTEVFVKHDYYSKLRIKIVFIENDIIKLCEYKGDSLAPVKEITTDKKLYPIVSGFLQFETGDNYYYFYEDGEYSIYRYKYIKHVGSSRSSKSFSLEEAGIRVCEEIPLTRFTVWRDTQTSLGDTIWKDFRQIFPLSGRDYKFPRNTTPIYFENQSVIEPHGDDTTNAHGLTQNIAWLNEPYRMAQDTFTQIDMRAEQVWLDINPTGRHWSDALEKHPRCKVIHSTFQQNPFCPLEMRLKILSYDPSNPINVKNGTADAYLWSVYGLGVKAEKPNRIFKNWEKITDYDFDALQYNSYYGLDFGTTNPSALVEVKYGDGAFYVRKRLYMPMSQMPEGGITLAFENIGIKKSDIIIADSADKDNRKDIQRNGFNIIGAKKGANSVTGGINLINKFKVFYVADDELEYEYENYEWEIFNGMNLERPIKKDDHLLDAFRYIHTWLCTYLNIK